MRSERHNVLRGPSYRNAYLTQATVIELCGRCGDYVDSTMLAYVVSAGVLYR